MIRLGIYISFFLILISCKESTKFQIVEVPESSFSSSFTVGQELNYQNVEFSDRGAAFNDSLIPSYIQIEPSLNIQNQFNISFWFNFSDKDPKIPQMLFATIDSVNPVIRFNIWVAGERITGVLNNQHLWANDYDYSKGRSAKHYDLFRLEPGKYYFLSLNYKENKLDVFVNAEQYASYNDLNLDSLKFKNILFGIEKRKNEEFLLQYKGYIRNVSIFNSALDINEIYSLSVESYSDIENFNREFELSKFNFD